MQLNRNSDWRAAAICDPLERIVVDSPNCRLRTPPPKAIREITLVKTRHVRLAENGLRLLLGHIGKRCATRREYFPERFGTTK